MKPHVPSTIFVLSLVATPGFTEGPPLSAEAFNSADSRAKRMALGALARHEARAADAVAIIRAGLIDADRDVRIDALGALSSHAAGPRYLVPEPGAAVDVTLNRPPPTSSQDEHDRVWGAYWNERTQITELRPLVVALLGDPYPRARTSAILALVNMDFDPERPKVLSLSEQTVVDLAPVYLRDRDGGVRWRVVQAFALSCEDSRAIRQVFLAALDDPSVQVRHQALAGVERVRLPEALPMVIKALRDSDAHARFLAAKALGAYCATGDCLTALEEALAIETDHIARGEMGRAIEKVRGRP